MEFKQWELNIPKYKENMKEIFAKNEEVTFLMFGDNLKKAFVMVGNRIHQPNIEWCEKNGYEIYDSGYEGGNVIAFPNDFVMGS